MEVSLASRHVVFHSLPASQEHIREGSVMPEEQKQPEPIKQMSGPFTPDNLGPTAVMALVAITGGLLAFYRKWKEGDVRAFNIVELIGELAVSGGAGLVAYWMFKGFGVNEYLTAAGVGIIGHMGSRAIFMAEQAVEKVVTKKTDEA